MSELLLDPGPLRPCPLEPPVSKSEALRALACAYLLGRAAPPFRAPLPDDVGVMRQGLEVLSRGRGGALHCADGGAPFRFLLALSATRPGRWTLSGTPRLAQRPHEPLLAALEQTLAPAGLVLRRGAPWPLEVQGATGRAPRPVFRLDGGQSSQYASALALAAAGLAVRERRPWTLELAGPTPSQGYLAITLSWLEGFGFDVRRARGELTFAPGGPRHPPSPARDWSSASYLLLIAWRSGGSVEGLELASAQPDRAILELLAGVGPLPRSTSSAGLTVAGAARRGLDAAVDEHPDLGPTLAALALALPAPSRLRRVANLRHKESDRVEGILRLVAAFGGEGRLERDELLLRPPSQPAPARFDCREDHRLALAAAAAAVLLGSPLVLRGAGCVSKSFPGFFEQLSRSGCLLRPLPGAVAATGGAPG